MSPINGKPVPILSIMVACLVRIIKDQVEQLNKIGATAIGTTKKPERTDKCEILF